MRPPAIAFLSDSHWLYVVHMAKDLPQSSFLCNLPGSAACEVGFVRVCTVVYEEKSHFGEVPLAGPVQKRVQGLSRSYSVHSVY